MSKAKAVAPKGKPETELRRLTPAERAEAASLFRSGTVTLEDLSKKFKKRPETFSRMFKKMGIEKGEAALAAAKKASDEAEVMIVTDLQETLRKIKKTKDDNYRMSQGLALMAWQELVRVRQAKLPIETLKETMATLKLAGDVIGNARKEIYAVLDVEKHDMNADLDDLPELTVRELTNGEITQLQSQSKDTEDEMGGDIPMLTDEEREGD
jgi:hypothetical protein